MDIEQKIEGLSDLRIGKPFEEKDKKLLAEIYKELFFKNVCMNCPDGYNDALIEIRIWNKNKIPIVMAKQKYQFKKEFENETVSCRAISMIPITKENLTDEFAEKMLKHPDLKDYIEEVKTKEEKSAK